MTPRKKSKINHARLIVGEGLAEQCFLKHLKSLYLCRDAQLSVKISQGQGGSPKHILDYAIRQKNSAHYDSMAVWMDKDNPWQLATITKAENHQPPVTLLASEPCVEGFFLGILGEPASDTTSINKARFKKIAGTDNPTRINFGRLFPEPLLQQASQKIKVLSTIIGLVTCP